MQLKVTQHQKHFGYGARELIVYLWMHCDHNYIWYLVHFIQNLHVLMLNDVNLRGKKNHLCFSFVFFSCYLFWSRLGWRSQPLIFPRAFNTWYLIFAFCIIWAYYDSLYLNSQVVYMIILIPFLFVQARTIGTLS